MEKKGYGWIWRDIERYMGIWRDMEGCEKDLFFFLVSLRELTFPAPRLSWAFLALLGSPGLSWAFLGIPWLPWAPLASPGISWAHWRAHPITIVVPSHSHPKQN